MKNIKNEAETADLDKLEVEENSSTARLLRAVGQNIQPRPEFIQQLEEKMKYETHAQPRPVAIGWHWPWLMGGFRPFALVGVAAAVLFLVVGTLVWLNQPAPVSAQQVLQRVAAGTLPPNMVAHRTFAMEDQANAPHSGTGEVWLKADASGKVIETAVTSTGFDTSGTVVKIVRFVITGDTVQQYEYRPGENTVQVGTYTISYFMDGLPNWFDGASIARYLSQLASRNVNGVKLLAPQTLNGVPVLAIQVADSSNRIFYFDAHSYTLREVDSPSQRVWLTQEEIRPSAGLPADTFAFNPPANARRIETDAGAKPQGSAGVDLQTLLTVCHLEKQALVAATQAGKTPLVLCQANNPSLTESSLIDGLIAPMKAEWDAQVAAGTLSATQEKEQLNALQTKLKVWVTMPLSGN